MHGKDLPATTQILIILSLIKVDKNDGSIDRNVS